MSGGKRNAAMLSPAEDFADRIIRLVDKRDLEQRLEIPVADFPKLDRHPGKADPHQEFERLFGGPSRIRT